jgi:hypothetical protein
MSQYDWEKGTIKLNVKEFSRVRKAMIDFVNERQNALFEKAKRIREEILKECFGKRTFNFEIAFFSRVKSSGDDFPLSRALFRGKGYKKPYMPRRKDFPLLNSRSYRIECGDMDALIIFDKEAHTVTWTVPENNRQVERARDTLEARKFFSLLSTVHWTRGTGGTIVGNDEYNRESSCEGGGGNYVVERYGPDVKKPVATGWRAY